MRNQIMWAVMIGLHVAEIVSVGGCLHSPGVACGNGWCSEGGLCLNPLSATPICVRSTCGNGLPDPDEECDDHNNVDGDGCSANCIKEPACGNSILDPEEQCDDGNIRAGDGCSATCKIEVCGNGVTDLHEDCDDGPDNGTADSMNHCNAFCQFNVCGDGILEPGEQCDDGTDSMGHNNNNAGARCNGGCQFNKCGDKDVLTDSEECDEGGEDTPTCDANCTKPVCGDMYVNEKAGEECDKGAANGTRGSNCDLRCKRNLCGNGVVDVDEECDDGMNGTRMDSARCNANCTLARCDDGYINHMAGEVCDNVDPTGASLNGIACNYGEPLCTRCNTTCTGTIQPGGPFCGNGVQDANESCDPSTGPALPFPSLLAVADSLTCDNDCTPVACGDGHVNLAKENNVAKEQCDDGNRETCGTCPVKNCDSAPITPAAATSTILTSDAKDEDDVILIRSGDTFRLDDGFGRALTFEFALSPNMNDTVKIIFGQDESASAIATEIIRKITAQNQSGFGITATRKPPNDNVVILTNVRESALGNKMITVHGLNGFQFCNQIDCTPRMAGGKAGDCPVAVGCASGDDCASGTCDPTTHKCM